ncbi:hypothetical protein [Paenibacillus tyrfis]|uniref:hypothetical protein n=1 Tax=Paenibacillus tyrfis TaxID=1501230 RepID=UPI000B58929C|nr:hypothetical protein [Paenibacillus tyrfis]
MAVTVTFVAINVNTLNRGATVSVGANAQSGWAQNGKNNFGNGNAVSLNNQSVIAVGENEQNGWSGVHKNNYGTGKCYGLNRIQQVSNTILDNDCIDSPARIETNVAETLVG